MRALVLAVCAAVLLLASACGGTPTVDGDQVADKVSAELAKSVGREPDEVTCPDLPGEKGEKIRCTLTDGGRSYGVSVVVTQAEGSDIRYSAEVDQQPTS